MYGECWFTGNFYFKHVGCQNATLRYNRRTIRAGRGRLEGGKTSGPPSATACGLQDFYPPARVRAEGGSCSAANSVPMVNRLFADCADREPLLGQLCLIWLNVAICVSCMHYYLYTVQS